MKSFISILVVAVVAGCASPASESDPLVEEEVESTPATDHDFCSLLDVAIQERISGAERVVAATVRSVQPMFAKNKFGDQLIISRATLAVEDVIKGPAAVELVVDVEGGTIGDLTLTVSDMPKIAAGERGVFLLNPETATTFTPHMRGLGILKEDSSGRLGHSELKRSDIRSMVHGH